MIFDDIEFTEPRCAVRVVKVQKLRLRKHAGRTKACRMLRDSFHLN